MSSTEVNLVELAPGPFEVALARIPAGMAVRAARQQHDGPPAAAPDLSPDECLRWVQVPGGDLPWGAVWSAWYAAKGIVRYRHIRDLTIWQQAVRLVNGGGTGWHREPLTVYVVHEPRVEDGSTVWTAVRIRPGKEQGTRAGT